MESIASAASEQAATSEFLFGGRRRGGLEAAVWLEGEEDLHDMVPYIFLFYLWTLIIEFPRSQLMVVT